MRKWFSTPAIIQRKRSSANLGDRTLCNYSTFSNAVKLIQRTDKFIGFDPISPNLNLIVDSAHEFDLASGQVAAQISCFV